MNIKILRTEADYYRALKRLDRLMDSELTTLESDELELLAILIEKYEDEHFPIEAPDPISAINFRMEQLGMSQSDLSKIIGANRASEILHGRRALSLGLIKLIHQELGIPYESLIGDHQLIKKCS